MKSKKTLTKKDVQEVAEKLITDNGETTSLDVKRELRSKSFFAIQSEVSQLLADVASENNWSSTSTGTYNIYKILAASTKSAIKAKDPNYDKMISAMNKACSFIDFSTVAEDDNFFHSLGMEEYELEECCLEIEKEFGLSNSSIDISNVNDLKELFVELQKHISTSSVSKPTPVIVPKVSMHSLIAATIPKKVAMPPATAVPLVAIGSYTNRNGKIISSVPNTGTIGNWKVTSKTNTLIMEFDGKYSRDEARQAYAHLNAVKFNDTRCEHIK